MIDRVSGLQLEALKACKRFQCGRSFDSAQLLLKADQSIQYGLKLP